MLSLPCCERKDQQQWTKKEAGKASQKKNNMNTNENSDGPVLLGMQREGVVDKQREPETASQEKNDINRNGDHVRPELSVAASTAPNAVNAETPAQRELVDTLSYLASLLGYCIGIGNVWRFPYLVGKWGGGAFVFAYAVCLIFVAMPLFLAELVMGQYTRKSTVDCFRMIRPRWVGLGYGQGVMIFLTIAYYNVVLAYSCVYIAGSLSTPVPWTDNTRVYWKDSVLNQQDADMGLGSVQWKLVAGLFAVTLICFLSLSFGKRILAKVTWVTVISPVVLLLVLLVRAAQLEGASDGINFYVGKFDASLLADAELWATACGQILFSLSPGFGTAITMSSYTHPRENVFKICIFVSLANSVFSIVGGFAIFSILGNLALTTGTTVAEVASSGGTGLAFVAIAEGIKNFGEASNVISVLFFAMLLLLGLDSSFAWIETFASYCEDFCHARGMRPQKWQLMAVLCTVFFLCGIAFCTQGGNQLLDIIDHYCTSYFLLLGCCLESIMFTVDFGWSRFVHAVTDATGDKLYGAAFWKLSLLATAPLATGCLFLQLLISDLKEPYGDYPAGFQAVGWITIVTCVALSLATCLRKGDSTLPSMASKADAEFPATSSI